MRIQLNDITKHFGQFQALSPLSLTIEQGEMMGLLGPSGSGKTTLLRIIAGLESSNSGQILFEDRDVTRVHVRDRRVGFVFQNYALFKHMTVAENIAFGLQVMPRRARPSPATMTQRVNQLLEVVQLGHLSQRYPEQLSGGQKQRIALARALATQPEILLLDEPFGALDAQVRKELRQWLRRLHDEMAFTSVFVTHDQDEALELSDRVVVMSNGQIEQVDSPVDLYAAPKSRFVFDFLGNVNVFSGHYQQGVWQNGNAFIQPTLSTHTQQSGNLYVRSHELTLADKPNSQLSLPMRVVSINPVGAEVRVSLAPQGWESEQLWEATLTHHAWQAAAYQKGDTVYAMPQRGYFFNDTDTAPHHLDWPFLAKDSLVYDI
ncbi:sulfate/molybdate ABC transporter ATP-binding protein [Salinivibrio sp. ES.052]|uniref:sulfate/molybdate ABC transporter ATP-binding protein n=1 Tax=Salinivibrio sp. ES.052 TaxID=1882823 RepID=UPI00092780A0|nr:TOBE-like domain-containing protein [Salinivibrio sp. ES.052]SIO37813.1 sulfate transport system ATP-binding protein [Salinivibrio sp. ES.052]